MIMCLHTDAPSFPCDLPISKSMGVGECKFTTHERDVIGLTRRRASELYKGLNIVLKRNRIV